MILAAGASVRFGRPKQLLEFGGRTLLRRTVESAIEAGCRPVLVVLGANADRLRGELGGLAADPVLNTNWREGMGSSIRAGIQALDEHTDVRGALLLTCDQPLINDGVIRAVCDEFDGAAGRIVACDYTGTTGIPVLFERTRFPDLLRLKGDRGARPVLERHEPDLRRIDWPDGAVDIDTPADYARLAGNRS